MKEIKRGLRPVKRRIRFIRLCGGIGKGALIAGLWALGVMALSFFWPMPSRAAAAWLGGLGIAALSGMIAGMLPVGDLQAAKAADAHGLKERAQTALGLKNETPMETLQRQDAAAALRQFSSKSIPLPRMKRTLGMAAAAAALSLALFVLPNPQNAEVESIRAFEKNREAAAEQIQAQAEEKEEERLSEKQRQELRRLLSDARREIMEAENEMEALLALGNAQERLEALREKMASEALSQIGAALQQQGLEAVFQAMESGDMQKMEEALSLADAQALSQAAGQTEAEAQALMNASAQALQKGDFKTAAGQLSQIPSALQANAASKLGSASQLLSSLRSSAGMNGQGSGQGPGAGQGGQNGEGSGAGKGSTNLEEGSGAEEQAGRRGTENPRYQEKKYESIYDPTRLNADQTELSAQSPQGEGESSQAQLGPGAGTLGESVPYQQVVHEYAQAASQAADHQNLTSQERQWVDEYFAALTE